MSKTFFLKAELEGKARKIFHFSIASMARAGLSQSQELGTSGFPMWMAEAQRFETFSAAFPGVLTASQLGTGSVRTWPGTLALQLGALRHYAKGSLPVMACKCRRFVRLSCLCLHLPWQQESLTWFLVFCTCVPTSSTTNPNRWDDLKGIDAERARDFSIFFTP